MAPTDTMSTAAPAVISRRTRVMGCEAVIVLVDPVDSFGEPHHHGAQRLLDAAVARLDMLERRWSRFRPDSDISRINAAGGRPVPVSADTAMLIAAMREAAELTDGRFDPTVPAIVFGAADDGPASGLLVSTAERPIGRFGELTVDVAGDGDPVAAANHGEVVVSAPPGVALDPGGIGKGLAADLVVAELLAGDLAAGPHTGLDTGPRTGLDTGGAGRTAGALVSIGGDLACAGRPPRPSGWEIDIDRATGDGSAAVRLTVDRGGVATSTLLAQRSATADASAAWPGPVAGVAHLVDPRTGRTPTGSADGVESMTVVAASGWRAEALALALAVDAGVVGAVAGHGPTSTESMVTDTMTGDVDTVITMSTTGRVTVAGRKNVGPASSSRSCTRSTEVER
jgi:thiamine biosynthesis lipoprotein